MYSIIQNIFSNNIELSKDCAVVIENLTEHKVDTRKLLCALNKFGQVVHIQQIKTHLLVIYEQAQQASTARKIKTLKINEACLVIRQWFKYYEGDIIDNTTFYYGQEIKIIPNQLQYQIECDYNDALIKLVKDEQYDINIEICDDYVILSFNKLDYLQIFQEFNPRIPVEQVIVSRNQYNVEDCISSINYGNEYFYIFNNRMEAENYLIEDCHRIQMNSSLSFYQADLDQMKIINEFISCNDIFFKRVIDFNIEKMSLNSLSANSELIQTSNNSEDILVEDQDFSQTELQDDKLQQYNYIEDIWQSQQLENKVKKQYNQQKKQTKQLSKQQLKRQKTPTIVTCQIASSDTQWQLNSLANDLVPQQQLVSVPEILVAVDQDFSAQQIPECDLIQVETQWFCNYSKLKSIQQIDTYHQKIQLGFSSVADFYSDIADHHVYFTPSQLLQTSDLQKRAIGNFAWTHCPDMLLCVLYGADVQFLVFKNAYYKSVFSRCVQRLKLRFSELSAENARFVADISRQILQVLSFKRIFVLDWVRFGSPRGAIQTAPDQVPITNWSGVEWEVPVDLFAPVPLQQVVNAVEVRTNNIEQLTEFLERKLLVYKSEFVEQIVKNGEDAFTIICKKDFTQMVQFALTYQ
ncbi:Hypothetical_protein [Hexamita inflata]|uniref:Hypothetical_protein n=1 Tax=Hexamita inflata TaxID=28002 RepID=A0AA86QVX3_9EUKA|nr:Hypothetical protein HINF_LOCUS51822 [Hexamita inflata]